MSTYFNSIESALLNHLISAPVLGKSDGGVSETVMMEASKRTKSFHECPEQYVVCQRLRDSLQAYD